MDDVGAIYQYNMGNTAEKGVDKSRVRTSEG